AALARFGGAFGAAGPLVPHLLHHFLLVVVEDALELVHHFAAQLLGSLPGLSLVAALLGLLIDLLLLFPKILENRLGLFLLFVGKVQLLEGLGGQELGTAWPAAGWAFFGLLGLIAGTNRDGQDERQAQSEDKTERAGHGRLLCVLGRIV